MKTDYNHDAGHNLEGYTPRKRCRWLEDISNDESHCSKGYPPDVRCWSGNSNPCWAYMADLPHLAGDPLPPDP